MNRRAFLKFLITAPITAALPWSKIAKLLPEPIAEEIHLTLDEIIAETLRKYLPQLMANLTANNTLLEQLISKKKSQTGATIKLISETLYRNNQ